MTSQIISSFKKDLLRRQNTILNYLFQTSHVPGSLRRSVCVYILTLAMIRMEFI